MADENEVKQDIAPIPEAPEKPKRSEKKKAKPAPELAAPKKKRIKPNPHALVKSFLK